jgi:hypothetical protein
MLARSDVLSADLGSRDGMAGAEEEEGIEAVSNGEPSSNDDLHYE